MPRGVVVLTIRVFILVLFAHFQAASECEKLSTCPLVTQHSLFSLPLPSSPSPSPEMPSVCVCMCHAALQIAKTLTEQVSQYAQVVLDSCAYAGSGNVLKVQELLALCGEHIETEEATAWKVRGAVGRGFVCGVCS